MADANASVILGGQQPANPLDSMVKALTLRDLTQKSAVQKLQLQHEQQSFNDQQAVRQAYKDNLVTNPDGTQSVNSAGVLSTLNKYNPQLGQQVGVQMQQAQLEAVHRHREEAAAQIAQVSDQPTYDAYKDWATKTGAPGAAQLPQQYDPGLVGKMQQASLPFKEQADMRRQQQEADAKSLEANANASEKGYQGRVAIGGQSGAAPGGASGGGGFSPPLKMQVSTMKDYNDAVAGSRQQQDAQQEMKNTLAAANINEIVKQAPKGDLNNLNPQQTKLAMMEVVKMAGGSVPTEGELESMTPNTMVQKYSGLMQNVTGKSQPANAGEFLKQGIDYANGLASVSKERLAARENDIADRFKQGMGDSNYKLVKGQIAKQYGSAAKAPTDKKASGGVMSFDQWKASQK